MRLNLGRVAFYIGLLLQVSMVNALNLGSISVTSSVDLFEARIAIHLHPSELQSIGQLQVSEASKEVYESLGLSRAKDRPNLRFTIENDAKGQPSNILVAADESLGKLQNPFSDVVVELKWSSGMIRRAYTVLSDVNRSVKTKSGDNLSLIAEKILPDMAGATFDQTLIALYRANPQAFTAGNIHRLKNGETLRLPSSAMANSIPVEESKRIMGSANLDYAEGNLEKSTEKVVVKSVADSQKTNEVGGDKLKIGSSTISSSEEQENAKHLEELVAQEKMLADAKLRIAQLEKNIEDLKRLTGQKTSNGFDGVYNWLFPILFVLVTLLLVFVLMRKRNQSELVGYSTVTPPSARVQATLRTEDEVRSPVVEHDPDMAKRAKDLFAGIDLNLDTPPKPTKVIPSVSEQRVKLNLAKSYLKIADAVTAEFVLQEIVQIGDQADATILNEAKQLLAQLKI